MRSSIEQAARALCRADGNPENTRFEGKAMWESYIPQAQAALGAVDHETALEALIPFALALEEHGSTRAVDDAFIWENGRQLLVSYGMLRKAHALVKKHHPEMLKIAHKAPVSGNEKFSDPA